MQRIAGDRPNNMMNRTWGIDFSAGNDYTVSDKCPRCGKPYYYFGDWFGDSPPICDCGIKQWWGGRENSSVSGWECPKCKRVYAPHVKECLHCRPPQFEWTVMTTTETTDLEDDTETYKYPPEHFTS